MIIPLISHPRKSTGQRCSVLARWDENTHIRLLSHSGQFVETPRPRRVKSVWGSHSSGGRVASSLPLLLKMEREIREGRVFQQSSRRPIIPFTLPFPTPPPLPRLHPSSSFPAPDDIFKGSMTVPGSHHHSHSENQTETVAVC